MGEFSHTNRRVLEQMRAYFPNHEPDVIDVGKMHVVGKRNLPPLALNVARQFGVSPFFGSERFRRHLIKTSYFFHRTRGALLQRLGSRRYDFTFQTQSLFDASVPGTPHFIYTDHTHLENLKYPAWTAATPLSREWAELEKSAYHNASMVFTMSENISRSLVQEYACPIQRIACVYAGSNVSADARESIDRGRFHAKNILFVGVDWERKGGPVLLEAFRSLREVHPDAVLTIVGCAPPIHQAGVHVVGRVPLTDVAGYYRTASIFCLPTLNEPLAGLPGGVFIRTFHRRHADRRHRRDRAGRRVGIPRSAAKCRGTGGSIEKTARRSVALRTLRIARTRLGGPSLFLGRNRWQDRSSHRAGRKPDGATGDRLHGIPAA